MFFGKVFHLPLLALADAHAAACPPIPLLGTAKTEATLRQALPLHFASVVRISIDICADLLH